MFKPTFVIFVETAAGEIINAFTWCRDAASGIERAHMDTSNLGIQPIKIWAQPIKRMTPEGA
jgi:hypothetical protein